MAKRPTKTAAKVERVKSTCRVYEETDKGIGFDMGRECECSCSWVRVLREGDGVRFDHVELDGAVVLDARHAKMLAAKILSLITPITSKGRARK